MLTHTDFHILIAQITERSTGCRMGCAACRNRDGRHAVRIALSEICNLVQRLALLGCRTDDMIQRNCAGKTAAVVAVFTRCIGDILLGYNLADIQPCLFAHFHNHVGAQHIARMIEHKEQHAMTLVRQLDCLKHALRIRCGKDITDYGNVQHSVADKAADCRLMTGAAEGDNRHTVCILQGFADNPASVYQLYNV